MGLKSTMQTSFESIINLMTDGGSVFVIPTFQRPYAWSKKQLDDLKQDIIMANYFAKAKNDVPVFHYLSPIHLIKVDDTNSAIMNMYLDHDNVDISRLSKSEKRGVFVDQQQKPLDVYMVVDGQQRITTLFFIYLQYFISRDIYFNGLQISLLGENKIPRLIQNPTADHDYMSSIFKHLINGYCISTLPRPIRQSQQRMLSAVQSVVAWAKTKGSNSLSKMDFLNSPKFCTALVELDKVFALTSFMTLNDRGKDLTVLERFKALMLGHDITRISGESLAHNIHVAFGKLYQVLDDCVNIGLFPKGSAGDDRMMQLISVYIRAGYHTESQWQDGQRAYTTFFHKVLNEAPSDDCEDLVKGKPVEVLLKEWLKAIGEISKYLGVLVSYIESRENCPDLGCPSLFYPNTRTLFDDYRTILLSLGLSPASMALLLKFKALYPNVEWHEKFSFLCVNDASIVDPLHDLLNGLQSEHPHVKSLLVRTRSEIPVMDMDESQVHSNLSMLEVIERIELYVWSLGTPRSNFMWKWRTSTDVSCPLSATDFITEWARWWYNGKAFVSTVASGQHESLFRYILKEYEMFLSGQDVHFDLGYLDYSKLELEHIFPQSFDNLPYKLYGFRTESDYNGLLGRSGNLTFLPKKCNGALGKNMPDLKVSEYAHCSGHPTGSGDDTGSKLHIVNKLGTDLAPIGPALLEYRKALEIRCVEIANFCLKRFLNIYDPTEK